MKRINRISLLCLPLLLLLAGCDKKDTEFRGMLGGEEVIYPAKVVNVKSKTGDRRVQLYWNPSPDPAVSKYVIYWNNKADSLVANAVTNNPVDTVRVLVPGLNESVYSFVIYSVDQRGNRSVPTEVNNVRVYGPVYRQGLFNRPYNLQSPYTEDGSGLITVHFGTPDTINIDTRITYTTTANITQVIVLSPTQNSIALPNYKAGTPVTYRSSYIPVSGAIDTFSVIEATTFPAIFSYVLCNKSLFNEVHLPNDVGTYGSDTPVRKLWDGSNGPQGYPNIFHSDGNTALAHHLTFDLGMVYNNLGRVEETGRDCCNNPDQFEVWGIADLTNAATTLPGNNAGWKAEMITKGWTLLKDITRTDDGRAPYKVDLVDNPPPVRYIRLRIKHVTTGDNAYSNISEITFWNKQ